jgi:hypothetical protein
MFVQWIIFCAETMILSSTNSNSLHHPAAKTALAARRASNYRLLRQIMADRSNWDKPSTVYDLAVTAIAEARAGESDVAKKHLSAAVELLERKRGLQSIQQMSVIEGLGVTNAFMSIPFPLFSTVKELENALDRIGIALGALEMWRSMVDVPTGLKAYIAPEMRVQWRAQVATLLIMANLLSSVSRHDAQEFIEGVEYMVISSEADGVLSPLALLFILCHCANQRRWWDLNTGSPLRIWEAIQLVAILDLAPRSRCTAFQFLSDKLNGDETVGMDFALVRCEAVVSWLTQHAHMKLKRTSNV